jgi:DNA-binding transcriptional MerR regulator
MRRWRVRIGELARRTGATTRALRYYEERGLLGSGRGENGYRDYGPEAVVRVRNIRRLLEAGLSSDDVRQLDGCLERDLDHEPTCQDAIALYEQRLASVERRIDALADVHRSLRQQLELLSQGRRSATAGRERALRPSPAGPASAPPTS